MMDIVDKIVLSIFASMIIGGFLRLYFILMKAQKRRFRELEEQEK